MEKVIGGIVIGIIVIGVMCLIFKSQESLIKDKVVSIGGEFVSCEPRIIDHPFGVVFRGEQAYQFTYKLHGQAKEGFVKFSIFTDWRL